MSNTKGWRNKAMVGVIGQKEYLKSFGDGEYYIVPKKLSIASAQEMQALLGEKNASKEKEQKDQNIFASDEAAFSRLIQEKPDFFFEFMRCMLMGGVHSHNLDDEDGKIIEWGEELVDQLVQMADDNYSVPLEIFGIVSRFNTPLGEQTPEKSGK